MKRRLGRVNVGCSLVLMTLMGLTGLSRPLSAQEGQSTQQTTGSDDVEDEGLGSYSGSRGMLFCVRPGQSREMTFPLMLSPSSTLEAWQEFGVSSFGPETLARRSGRLPPPFPTKVAQMGDSVFEVASDPELQLTRILVCVPSFYPSVSPESE
ncbi:hypothetical protein [Sodalinema gerasimenkoae]|uniref:hypothetical protein n=1 Tax=Sodalinema gerasimenkoae TaxID=2862348 RepID=UPI00135B7D51|nr:hypothetical protein [Sodalinema gerasimenkoae]